MSANSRMNPASKLHPSVHRRGFTVIEFLAVIGIIGLLFALLLPATRSSRPAARRMYCRSNLKQLAMALHEYAQACGTFPPPYTVDSNGKPLHSWRTLILPYLHEAPRFATIDLSKAWDDPVNAPARESVPSAFRCPDDLSPQNFTTYFAVVAKNGSFQPDKATKLSEITDDHGQTFLLIEVATEQAAHWMSPVDADESLLLSLNPKSKLAHPPGTHVVFVDGSNRFITADMPVAERRARISIAGHERIVDE